MHSPFVANILDPLSLRFTPADLARIQRAADQLGVRKHALCRWAVLAAIDSIEREKGLVLPLEFKVRRLPQEDQST